MARRAARLGVCLVLWLATGAYLLPFVDRGWIAHDDGMLGQAAERVMAGELPHRDFYDPYLGGLAYLHALGFKILGVRLVSLRVAAFCRDARMGAGCLLPCGAFRSPNKRGTRYGGRRRMERSELLRQHAVVLQLVPRDVQYAALFRHIERGGRRWLVLAGCCGGLSFLVKSVGIFFLVAGSLFLLFRAQIESRRDAEVDDRPSTGFLVLETAGCSA